MLFMWLLMMAKETKQIWHDLGMFQESQGAATMLEIQLDGMLMGRKLSESSWHHFLHWLPAVQLPRMAEINIRNAAGGRHSGHLRPADLGFSQWTFWFWRAKALEAPDIWIWVKRTNCWHGELQWVWMKCELWWHAILCGNFGG
jgi:hypothetical protein